MTSPLKPLPFMPKPLQITVYQDVLCAWCYLADSRLEVLRQEFRNVVRFRVRPYPLRINDVHPRTRSGARWWAR
jgi:predicted DsbA family dithiol-disulfide isomerase